MEHNISVASPLAQNGLVTKNQGGSGLIKAQAEAVSLEFGEVMRDAMQENGPRQVTALAGLEQQIMELSVETESLLVNAKPEAVEDILAQAVAELWELVGNFDAQNGTQFVPELSEKLTQTALAPEDLQGTTDIAELFSATFIQPANILVAQTVVSDIPTPTGRVEMQSLVVAQAQPQASEVPLFANVTKLLPQPLAQSLAQNGENPRPASQAIANTSVLAGIELIPKAASDWPQQIQQFVVETPLKNPALESAVTGQLAIELANKTFAVETPLKNPALESAVTGQLAIELANKANKAGADTIQLSGSDAVKAKVKELLALSAQAIVSNGNTPATTNENLSQLLQTRTELQSVTATALPEHTRPARSFSQNIASQIQGRPLNEGITRIELAPRGLGSVVIELQKKETGDMQIIVKAENPAVLHALRTDREMLLSVLSNEVSAQDGVDLEFEEFSEGQFDRDKGGVNLDEELAQSKLENEDDEGSVDPASTVKQPLGAGRLDILT